MWIIFIKSLIFHFIGLGLLIKGSILRREQKKIYLKKIIKSNFLSRFWSHMLTSVKIVLSLVVLLILSFIGWNGYLYFFSSNPPLIEIEGIEQNSYQSGDVQCIIKVKDEYKVNSISIFLDSKPLITNHRISKKSTAYPFLIPTKTLTNGKHILKIDVNNAAYHKAENSKEIAFNVDNLPLQAAFIKGYSDAKVFQGRTLHVQFQVNKEIKSACARALSKEFNCCPESKNSLIYECFIPTECEEVPNEYLLSIEIADFVGNVHTLESKFQVIMYPFKKQTIKIDPTKIKLENEIGLPEKELESELERLSKNSPCTKLWQGVFYTPIEIKDPKQVTTQFGVIRTTQERGLRQHKAIDIYNTPKSVVWATQDGIVVLKNRYVHSGNTVVVDHGCGVLSLFYHLDTFANIEVGEKIKKGNPVGTIGKTGYATGYHLHWEMRVGNVAVDPEQWTKHDF